MFTARAGGVSSGPRASLNLQTGGDDDSGAVESNFALVRDQLDGADIAVMDQVHGNTAIWLQDSSVTPRCDAILTTQRRVALMVRVADCVPILVYASDNGAIAAIHAGRGGLLSGIVPRTINALYQAGGRELHAWIGPRACGSCYELPEHMVAEARTIVPGIDTQTSKGTTGIDIGMGVSHQLATAGVHITDVGAGSCTIEDEQFYSYRRQGANSGRFSGIIMLQ